MTNINKPTEINNEECEGIIKGTYHGVLSFSHESEPYAIPINHAYAITVIPLGNESNSDGSKEDDSKKRIGTTSQ